MNWEKIFKRIQKGLTIALFVFAAVTCWITKSLAELLGKIYNFLKPYKNDLKHSVTGEPYQPEEVCEVTPEEPVSVKENLDDSKSQDN